MTQVYRAVLMTSFSARDGETEARALRPMFRAAAWATFLVLGRMQFRRLSRS